MEFKDINVMTLEELKAYEKELNKLFYVAKDETSEDEISLKILEVAGLMDEKYQYVEIGQ